jgi:quercetin dioxygenase-like cupin family protein
MMNAVFPRLAFVTVSGMLLVAATAAQAQETSSMSEAPAHVSSAKKPLFIQPGQLKWGPDRNDPRKGLEIATLEGNQNKSGPVVFRYKLSPNYEIVPHVAAKDLRITVLSGDFNVGVGRTFSRSKTHHMRSGAFIMIPHGTPHYGWSRSGGVIQIDSTGPVDLRPVHPNRHQ